MEKQVISTNIIKRNEIKLPYELSNHPNLDEATIEVRRSQITFLLPAKPGGYFREIWQYVHDKQAWVVVTFN